LILVPKLVVLSTRPIMRKAIDIMYIVMGGILLLRLIMGIFLLSVGILKVRNGHNHLLASILGYDLVPERVATILARWLPWLEILSGLLLIFGFISQFAVLLAFGLFLIYTGAIVHSLVRGKDNDCGCFKQVTPVQWRLVYRNIILMGLLLPIYEFKGGTATIDERLLARFVRVSLPSEIAVLLIIVWGVILVGSFILHRLFRKQVVQN